MGFFLKDEGAYCIGIFRNMKEFAMRKGEIEGDDSSRIEDSWAEFLADIYLLWTILSMFSDDSVSGRKISTYAETLQQYFYLEVNDIWNRCKIRNLNMDKVFERTKELALEQLKAGRSSETIFVFEKEFPKHFLGLRASMIDSYSPARIREIVNEVLVRSD